MSCNKPLSKTHMKTRSNSFMHVFFAGIFACQLWIYACSPKIQPPQTNPITKAPASSDSLEIAIVQLNDVYEISGVEGGTRGNLARVAHYIQETRGKYPNTLTVMAGDFLNPSLINTMKYQGERIRGRQMIDVLNAMEIDLAAFGNHEFDFDYEDLQNRIDSSRFDWIATNIDRVHEGLRGRFHRADGSTKTFIPRTQTYTFSHPSGRQVSMGVISACIDSNPKEYVHYYDADSCARVAVEALKGQTDILIGLTHLSLLEDVRLADFNQELALIMGGHEHDHIYEQVGKVPIAKADANAKTIYFHLLKVDMESKAYSLHSKLIPIDETVPKEPSVAKVINKWEKIMESEIRTVIEEPNEVVFQAKEALDGRESTIRHKASNLGKLFTQAMIEATSGTCEIALLNSGSIRIDDQIQGDIRGIDIFRALPFGGGVVTLKMKGDLLKKVMKFSETHKGSGAFLQYTGLSKAGENWKLGEEFHPGRSKLFGRSQ